MLLRRKQARQECRVLLHRFELGACFQGGLELLVEVGIGSPRRAELFEGSVLIIVEIFQDTQVRMGSRQVGGLPRGRARGGESTLAIALLQQAVHGAAIEIGEVQVEQPPQLR